VGHTAVVPCGLLHPEHGLLLGVGLAGRAAWVGGPATVACLRPCHLLLLLRQRVPMEAATPAGQLIGGRQQCSAGCALAAC
jgi:hypothetical protein